MKGESPSLAVKEKQLTWLYRCVVSDKKKSATSNTVRLMDFTLGETKPVYRALLIGMENFYDDVCTRNRVDVEKMASLLGKATAPGGTKYKVTRKYDLGYDEVRQAIQTTFADTKETDVSLFMISTHGDSDNQGQLCCTPYYDMISFATLANWLNTYVQGKVVVILQSCGSGSAIYKEGVTENAVNAADEADAAFVEQAAAAFSAADKGVTEIVANMAYNAKGEPVAVNTAELRTSKFYVLAASRHHEMSWGDEDVEDPSKSGNYFIKWLIDGIGQRGSSPADTSPKNYVFTLEELFSYIKRFNTYAFYYQGKTYNQHVQRYPKNSKYPILMFP
jgi:protein-tyrosine-phosphatase